MDWTVIGHTEGSAPAVFAASRTDAQADEHRWSERTAQTLDVSLYNGDAGLVRTHSRDISLGGMFIETGQETLSLNDRVTLVFNLRGGGEISHHRLPASVVRIAPGGAGLMYQNSDAASTRELRAKLYGAGARPAGMDIHGG